MNVSPIFLILLSTSVAACTNMPTKDPLYSGKYFYNFESSFLTPEGKDEAWCIDAGKMSKAMLPATDANGSWGTSHVILRGKLAALVALVGANGFWTSLRSFKSQICVGVSEAAP